MVVRGSVDAVTSTEIVGWAFAPGLHAPVRVQAVLNHEILGEAMADGHRPDLAAAGLGDGNSGYIIRLYRPVDPAYLPFLSVKVDDGDAELPRAPALGFADFFAQLYRQHPAAGRSRSVFGGLWTDRTDAAAMLRGKIAIGQIAPPVAAPLTQLIQSGVTVLDLAVPADANDWRESLAERVGDLLEHPVLLPLLRPVLEDNPLALRSDWLHDRSPLAQPSTLNPAPSPAECVSLLVAFGDGATLDVVRDSHRLPEFTPTGQSRWANGAAAAGAELVATNGLLDRFALAAGRSVAVVGAGTLYRVRCGAGGAAVQVVCVPSRQTPLDVAA